MPYNLSLEDVGYRYGNKELFRNASFSVGNGERLVIAGRSGSGKSTLLEICAGILEPHEGTVFWNGKDVQTIHQSEMVALKQRMGVVFQKHALISNFTIFENIALPLRYHTSMSDKEVRAEVEKHLELVDISPVARFLPEALSFGQAKLVSIARALVMKPDFILMDEPLSGLDPVASQKVVAIILKLFEQKNTTIIIVSNVLHLIQELRCPVVFINNGGISFHSNVTIIHDDTPISEFSLFMSGKV